MNTILTLKYGNKYTAEDVNRIYHTTQGKYNYVCVTDDITGLHSDIYTIPIGAEIEGHWEKIKLFKLNNLGKILYLDLDIRVQKNLDHLFEMLTRHLLFVILIGRIKISHIIKTPDGLIII